MNGVNPEELRRAIRDIPDFPKPGIVFRDISPVLSRPELFRQVVDALAAEAEKSAPTKIVGIDARGFLFGAAVAYKLGLGFIPVRKKGKLPYRTICYSYVLEYGRADMEMHIDAVQVGEKVVLVDDLLATGGTSAAAVHLIHQLGATVEAALFFIELVDLEGRKQLAGVPVKTLVQF
ncbi:MAG TPA: adenine phosphoribosyltransferase [Chthoniobacterales bacterium]|nr:adenine phosphoribosyltransferase [Chthoniobacterales bacterium]